MATGFRCVTARTRAAQFVYQAFIHRNLIANLINGNLAANPELHPIDNVREVDVAEPVMVPHTTAKDRQCMRMNVIRRNGA
jgi:hypothetical protein